MKKIILIILIILATGCSNNIEEISVKKLKDLEKNKESFIIEVMQDGCSHCQTFTPKLKKVVNSYNIKNVYKLNLTNLSGKDNTWIVDNLDINSTPTVIFYKKGKQTSTMYRIIGDVNEDVIITKLKSLNYIK